MRFHHGEDVEFFVNKEKRTVVAVLRAPQFVMVDEMMGILSKSSANHFVMDAQIHATPSMMISGEYRGVAHCHNDDEFNEEYGKELARLRAIRKYTEDRKRVAHIIADIFKDASARFDASERYFENDYSQLRDKDTIHNMVESNLKKFDEYNRTTEG